jgi:hypothetical protein
MTQALPVSRLINVGVVIAPKAAQQQNLSSMLLLGTSEVIDTQERYRIYATIDAVSADFGTTAPEYLAALLWFSQSPQPAPILIGRWANVATKGGVRGKPLSATEQALANFTAIVAGSFSYQKDGAAATNVTGLNFSAATSLSDVAATIQANAGMAGTTVVWNPTYARFEVKSNTAGAASAISFFAAHTGAIGVDVSGLLGLRSTQGGYVWAGQALETAIAAVTLFDANYGQAWYGLHVLGAVTADHLAIAAFVEATNNKHLYSVNTQDANVLSAAAQTDVAYQLKALGYKKTFVQYSSASAYAVISALAKQLSVDYSGSNTTLTLMFKQEPGVVAEALNATQIAALEGKNCNVFVAYNNNTAILEPAVTSSGIFVDVITGTDWMATDIQTALFNALYTNTTKIPQTDDGMHMLKTVIESRCSQAVINGLLGPGTWTDGGFGLLKTGDFLPNGFYVYAPSVASQSVADRGARKSVPFQVAAKMAGAVHSIQLTINVNQ